VTRPPALHRRPLRFTVRLRARNHAVTGRGKIQVMRTLFALFATIVLLAVAGGATAGLRITAGPPPFPVLPGDWSHAEINIKIKKVPHTLILDRGRITQVSGIQLTLRHPDGTVEVVPLAPSTIYQWKSFGVRPRVMRRGLFAETMRIDEGAAVRVRLSLRQQ
jgi:hypothetical protein